MLGLGQQFLAYGIHPDTGQPYHWPVETLADMRADELPAITEAQAREFAKEAYLMIPVDQRPKSVAVGLSAPAESANLPEQRGTPEAVTEALGFILNADLDYDSWVRIGMAIKGDGARSEVRGCNNQTLATFFWQRSQTCQRWRAVCGSGEARAIRCVVSSAELHAAFCEP